MWTVDAFESAFIGGRVAPSLPAAIVVFTNWWNKGESTATSGKLHPRKNLAWSCAILRLCSAMAVAWSRRTNVSIPLLLPRPLLMCLALTLCAVGLGFAAISAYAASLDLPASSVGLIVAVPAFARACLNLPAGRLADVLGRKRPMIVGSVLDAVGCLGTAMAGGLPSMAGSRLVMGPSP